MTDIYRQLCNVFRLFAIEFVQTFFYFEINILNYCILSKKYGMNAHITYDYIYELDYLI